MMRINNNILFRNTESTERMKLIFDDKAIVNKWLIVEAALAKSQGELGIIPKVASNEIVKKAKLDNINLEAVINDIEKLKHPLVPFISQLANACKDNLGEYVHWGATTQDIMDTGKMLQIREAIQLLDKDINRIQSIMVNLIEENHDTILAGRTHGQHALPISLSFKIAIWLEEINRSVDRMTELEPRLFVGQLSGAVGTLASIKEKGLILQEAFMDELDLISPTIAWHSSRDNLAELASTISILTTTVEKIANEIYQLQITEINEINESDGLEAIGSSTMPQKKNPVHVESIITNARQLRNDISIFWDNMVNQHERDVISWYSEVEAIPNMFILAAAIISNLAELLEGLIINKEEMVKNLNQTEGLIVMEAVMLKLAEKMGRQEAHHLIHQISMNAIDNNQPIAEELLNNEMILNNFTKSSLKEVLDPKKYIGYSKDFSEIVLNKTIQNYNLNIN